MRIKGSPLLMAAGVGMAVFLLLTIIWCICKYRLLKEKAWTAVQCQDVQCSEKSKLIEDKMLDIETTALNG